MDKTSATMKKGNSKLLIRNLRKMKEQEQQKQALDLSNVVESAELVACDEQGTPIIGEHGEKICNCAKPWQSLFPDSKYYCLHCWGKWYH